MVIGKRTRRWFPKARKYSSTTNKQKLQTSYSLALKLASARQQSSLREQQPCLLEFFDGTG